MDTPTTDILILNAHPGRGRLAHALADAYADGATQAGATTSIVALADLSFDLSLHEGLLGEQPLEPDLGEMQRRIEACRHLVIVTPLWWGSDPALLKGFVDRTFERHWAYRYSERGLPQGLLGGRSARVIRTMDTPTLLYRFWLGRPADRPLERAILRFCGFGPVRRSLIGGVHAKTQEALGKDIERLRAVGRRDGGRLAARPRVMPHPDPIGHTIGTP